MQLGIGGHGAPRTVPLLPLDFQKALPMTAIVRALILLLLLAGGTAVRAQNLLTNGNFEAGLAGWSTWTAPPGFWDGTWIHSNDCDIWVPTQCPFGGAGMSHAQKKGSGAGNAHGGLFQTVAVTPGRVYRLRGAWCYSQNPVDLLHRAATGFGRPPAASAGG